MTKLIITFLAMRKLLPCIPVNTISADGNKIINQPIRHALYWSGWNMEVYGTFFFLSNIYILWNIYIIFFNRASWSGGIGTSAEVPAFTSSNLGHSGFNIPSVGALDPQRRDNWECGCPDTRVTKKKKKYIYIYTYIYIYKFWL